jgi:hypothetical protein
MVCLRGSTQEKCNFEISGSAEGNAEMIIQLKTYETLYLESTGEQPAARTGVEPVHRP